MISNQNKIQAKKNGQVVAVLLLVIVLLFFLGMWSGASTAAPTQPLEATAYAEDFIIRYQASPTGSMVIVTYTVFLPFVAKYPTPTPSPTPTPIYFDDFSNTSSGWQAGTANDWCDYEYGTFNDNGATNGVFRISVSDETDTPQDRCIALNFSLDKYVNGEFTVRARRTTASSRKVHYGFYFGAGQDAAQNHWYLQIFPDEVSDCENSTRPFFWLSALDDRNDDGDLKDDGDVSLNFPVCTDTINGNEDEWNVMKVRRNGANVDVYINGTLKKSVSEDILQDEGYFNLVIWGFEGLSDDRPAVVEFDYVRIDGLP